LLHSTIWTWFQSLTFFGDGPFNVPGDNGKPSDTLVSRRAVVDRELAAVDSNGTVETILWGTVKTMIDSAQADSSGRAVATFSHPEGGALSVLWAVRDDDGLMTFDTFDLMFNRGPFRPGYQRRGLLCFI
jgi:hypothetical protein